MMYIEHFGLSDQPFRLTADLEYYYVSAGHARARAYVNFSVISRDGFVVITGDVGSGKTMLLRKLVQELPVDAEVVHLEHTQLTPIEFLRSVCRGLGGEVGDEDKVQLIQRIRERLEDLHEQGVRVVVAVDEAQALSIEVLEEIRMLGNVESHQEKLICFVLIGQPELDDVIDRPGMEQLRQRVRLRFRLQGLSQEETMSYVNARLVTAGASRPESIIDEACYPLIQQYTGGIPRLVNTLCDTAMLSAYADHHAMVTEGIMREAIDELGWRPYSDRGSDDGSAVQGGATVERDASVVVPMTLLRRIADALDRMDGHMSRLVDALPRSADAGDAEATADERRRGPR